MPSVCTEEEASAVVGTSIIARVFKYILLIKWFSVFIKGISIADMAQVLVSLH